MKSVPTFTNGYTDYAKNLTDLFRRGPRASIALAMLSINSPGGLEDSNSLDMVTQGVRAVFHSISADVEAKQRKRRSPNRPLPVFHRVP